MTCIKDIKILSSLEKIYDSDKMPDVEYKGFSMLKNERYSFQIPQPDCGMRSCISACCNNDFYNS